MSAGAGFVVGTGKVNLPIVQKMTTQLENMQTELKLLKTELAKKTGIVILPETQTADAALNKAESLMQQGQLADAALYFSNAWANRPEWQVLQHYQQIALQYCHKLIEKGELETALQMLADMDNFLRTQTAHLTVPEIEQLQQVLADISTLKQATETTLAEKQPKAQEVEKSQTDEAIATLTKRVEYFLTQAANESTNSEFTFYYLTSAQSILQQLVLLASDSESVKTLVVQLSEKLEKTKQTILHNQSKAAWDEINKGLEAIPIAEVGKAEDILQPWLKRRQVLAERVNKLTSPESLQQAQEVMEKINTEITRWQTEQQRRYDRWAIAQIESFYKIFKELGKQTDPGMLGEIDTRYLSFPSNAAYNEVFSAYYGKLDTEQKIAISSQMMLMRKQKLSRF
jgi:hypothetical protein